MSKIKAFLVKLHQWALSHPQFVKPFHTFWQTFVSLFVLAATPILHTIPAIHSASDAKVVVFSLVAAALASAFSAAKNSLWPALVAWATTTASQITYTGAIPSVPPVAPSVPEYNAPTPEVTTPESDAGPAPDPTPPRKTSSRPE